MPRVLLYAVPSLTRVAFLLMATLGCVQGQTAGYVIETIAGIGRPTGNNGPATAALLNTPAGIAIDRSGNVFFAEESAHRVRKIDAAGKSRPLRAPESEIIRAMAALPFAPVCSPLPRWRWTYREMFTSPISPQIRFEK